MKLNNLKKKERKTMRGNKSDREIVMKLRSKPCEVQSDRKYELLASYTKEYAKFIGLKDKPIIIPEGKTFFRGIIFLKNKKIFDEVILTDLEDYEYKLGVDNMSPENRKKYTIEEYRKIRNWYDKIPNINIIETWYDLFEEKVGKEMKDENGIWYEYSVFEIEEDRWGEIIHLGGSKD